MGTEKCMGCPVGYYRNATMDPLGLCHPCPFGFLTEQGNATSVEVCSVGKYFQKHIPRITIHIILKSGI